MGEAKRKSNTPRNPEADAKVVAVRDVRFDGSALMRQQIAQVAQNNAVFADKSSTAAFCAYLKKLFAKENLVFLVWRDPRERAGIAVMVAKGQARLQAGIKADRDGYVSWAAFQVRDENQANFVAAEFGDVAMVTVPFDGDDADEMKAALAKAHSLARYEMNRENERQSS